MTKAQVERQTKLIPPFKSPSRQNVVCELLFSGKTRKEIKSALPALLKERNLGESASVESLITTTITGLTRYKGWTVVRQPDGSYHVNTPAKSVAKKK